MARLFGTDGVRGLANGEILTASLAQNLATSAALVLTEELRVSGSGRKPLAVIGNWDAIRASKAVCRAGVDVSIIAIDSFTVTDVAVPLISSRRFAVCVRFSWSTRPLTLTDINPGAPAVTVYDPVRTFRNR